MKQLIFLAALLGLAWILVRRPSSAIVGVSKPSIADAFGFGFFSDLFDGFGGNGIGGTLPYLGTSPRGPFGSAPVSGYWNMRDRAHLTTPFDASSGSIGGWGGGIGSGQYDPWRDGCYVCQGILGCDPVPCLMSEN